jgi:hypothetical protein
MAVASCLTAGITFGCSDACCSGGVNRIWIAKREDITTITRAADDTVTAIVMNGLGVFYEMQFLEFTALFNESATQENNNTSIDQTVEFTIPCLNDTQRIRLQEILNCCCGMVAIVELLSGRTVIIGDNVDLTWGRVKARSIEGTSGAALADANQYVATVGTFSAKLAVEFVPGPAGVPV